MLPGLFAAAEKDTLFRVGRFAKENLESLISHAAPAMPVLEQFSAGHLVKLIAEIKRASPSKGDLAPIKDVAELAKTYAAGGAAAISVLTESSRFKGALEDLAAVREAVSIPILRKDFISNEQQVLEARACGADLVLLIVAGLDQKDLEHLARFIESFGMTPFIETHDASEIERAVDAGARMIGINARNLSTFETDNALFAELSQLLPENCIAVAESAVRNVVDVSFYASAGADMVLVGEALVTGDTKSLLSDFSSVEKIRL